MIKKVVISTHSYAPGTSQAFRDYCQRKKMKVLFIEHPLETNLLTWGLGALDTLWQVVRESTKFDLYFGSNNLNTFIGLICRKLGRVKKVVYFTVDWSPQRFKSRLLNQLYHYLDYFCVKNADKIWNSSAVMPLDPIMRAREKNGYPKAWRLKQIQVPDGTDPFPNVPFHKINRYQIGFVGHLRKGMGLELLFEIFPALLKKLPQVKLLIIGAGPLEEKLRKTAPSPRIEFTGLMTDLKKVYKKLACCAISVAPYEPQGIDRYSDPGKVKNYLSVGLAVIITKVPCVAWEIEKEGAGLAVKYSKKELSKAILKLLQSEKLLKACRKNARRLAKKYSWDNIFDRALSLL